MTEQSGALAGKVAFVAGASRGIGATVATALAREGAAVAVAARSEQQGKVPGTIHSVADGIRSAGGRAMPVSCDVTSEESVENAVAATVSEFGGIDILIANAGVLWLGPIESTPLKRWQLCLNVNLTGVFLVTKAVIPHVKARGGGSLVAITTTGVGMIEHGANAYWVSKAAVERLYLRFGRRPQAGQHRRELPEPVARRAHRGLAGRRWRRGDPARDGRTAGGDGRRRGDCWPRRTHPASPAPSNVPKNSPPSANRRKVAQFLGVSGVLLRLLAVEKLVVELAVQPDAADGRVCVSVVVMRGSSLSSDVDRLGCHTVEVVLG